MYCYFRNTRDMCQRLQTPVRREKIQKKQNIPNMSKQTPKTKRHQPKLTRTYTQTVRQTDRHTHTHTHTPGRFLSYLDNITGKGSL